MELTPLLLPKGLMDTSERARPGPKDQPEDATISVVQRISTETAFGGNDCAQSERTELEQVTSEG